VDSNSGQEDREGQEKPTNRVFFAKRNKNNTIASGDHLGKKKSLRTGKEISYSLRGKEYLNNF
jgi:hypothetical protein